MRNLHSGQQALLTLPEGPTAVTIEKILPMGFAVRLPNGSRQHASRDQLRPFPNARPAERADAILKGART